MDRPDITAPIYIRLNGIECKIGALDLPANGEPLVTLDAELLKAALRVSGIEWD